MKKEFNNAEIKKLIRVFSLWQADNLIILQGKRESNVADTFGLPYTSSGAYAGLWNTNTESRYTADNTLNFEGIGYNDDGLPVAIFTRLDDMGNEIEDVFIKM